MITEQGPTATVQSIGGNIMGTTSVVMKAGNMRKAEGFIVYPIGSGTSAGVVRLQSEHRTAVVDTSTGFGMLSAYVADHPTFAHLAPTFQRFPFSLSALDLEALRLQVFTSTNPRAGRSGLMFTDNSGAAGIL